MRLLHHVMELVAGSDHTSVLVIGLLLPLLFLTIRSIYRVFFHPLSHIPGPPLPKITSAWLNFHTYLGDETTAIHLLHQKYGPIVRIGPRDVDISDGAALNAIYADKGGFRKAEYYRNFDMDGHITIFSATDPAYRAPRAKSILPLFSTANLRGGGDAINKCVKNLVARIKEESNARGPVNIINLTRSFAIDTVTTYLLHQNYGGLQEPSLSAAGMVDTFVAGNRFFYLPAWLFSRLLTYTAIVLPDREADESLDKVDKYVNDVVSRTSAGEGTSVLDGNYPSRMIELAHVSSSEAAAQSKDLIFAGGDSTGMNLTTIMLNLSRSPTILATLKAELTSSSNASIVDPIELQSLPYLRGTVREGLRTSMANPTRLGRVVPREGWTFTPSGTSRHANSKSQPQSSLPTFLPGNTIVSCSPYELHLDPRVFPSPDNFSPERWSVENETEEMRRNFIPFGLGSRQCIARNLATVELFAATAEIARSGVLEGSRPADENLVNGDQRIPILEWFNSKVVGGRVDLRWD